MVANYDNRSTREQLFLEWDIIVADTVHAIVPPLKVVTLFKTSCSKWIAVQLLN